MIEAQRNIGNLMKYASYVLGTAEGLDQDIETDLREISDQLRTRAHRGMQPKRYKATEFALSFEIGLSTCIQKWPGVII